MLVVGPVAVVCLHPSKTAAEGIGPFPVRNFNPLQQLVLNMPGDRAVVLKPGTLVYRVGEHWLWQGYGVENIDLTTGGAADFTLPTADLPVSVKGGRFRQTT